MRAAALALVAMAGPAAGQFAQTPPLSFSWSANPEPRITYRLRAEALAQNMVEIPAVTTWETTELRQVIETIDSGTYMVTLQAVDEYGLESPPSPAVWVTVEERAAPPPRMMTLRWRVRVETSTDLRSWSSWGATTIEITVPADKPREFFRVRP